MPADLPAAPEVDTGRRRFFAACATGSVLAGGLFVWMITRGTFDLLHGDLFGGFYDAQARSLLHGHWYVSQNDLKFEAFIVHGHAYTYFGPWPALLRMPVVAFTHHFDGRLTRISMLLAFAVAMGATSSLSWRIRTLVRGDAPVGRLEAVAAGAYVFVLGAGSTILFLASEAIIYHEPELWGAAWAIAGFDLVLAYIIRPRPRTLVLACVLATLAFLSRGSVGAGPVVALAILLGGALLALVPARRRHESGERRESPPGRALRWLALPMRAPVRRAGALAAAVAVPVALYVYVNWAKFGTLFTVPFDRQVFSAFNPNRRAALAANGGSLFGLKFVPTTLVQYFRPDALRVGNLFPYLRFPPRATVFGSAVFDTLDRTSSVPATMPAFTLLGLGGVIAILAFRRRSATRSLAPLRVLLVAAVAGSALVFTIAFVANRYLSDFLPLVVLCSLAGLHVLVDRLATRPGALVRMAAGLLVVFAVFGVWANASLALWYQRVYGPDVSQATRAGFISFQQKVYARFPGGPPPDVATGSALPHEKNDGALFVLGDCAGLYWSDGSSWYALQRTEAAGQYRLRVTFPAAPAGTREPLVTIGIPGAATYIAVRSVGRDRVRLGALSTDTAVGWIEGPVTVVRPGRALTLDIVADPRLGLLDVANGAKHLLTILPFPFHTGATTVGRNDIGGPVAPAFTGRIEHLSQPIGVCRYLQARLRAG